MFGVAQFMENGRLQVLAVPMSWIRKGLLMWPKSLSNDKIDKMRKEGTAFNGATKGIPVLVTRKFRSFQAAESSVEELSKKDVSDFEGKKKLLKSNQKKRSEQKRNDYNELCTAIAHKKRVNSTVTPPAGASKVVPQLNLPPPVEQFEPRRGSPELSNQDQESSAHVRVPHGDSSPVASSSKTPPLEARTPRSTVLEPSKSAGIIEAQNNIVMLPCLGSVTSFGNQGTIMEREQELVEWMPEEIQVKALEITDAYGVD
nr:uncharacterized protein LOC115256214 isoform X2 [Aedes albopictus]